LPNGSKGEEMTKERFFQIIELPAGVTEAYLIINHNIWFITSTRATNIKNEEFSVGGGDLIFEKYFFSTNEIDLVREMLNSMRLFINSAIQRTTELIDLLEEYYQENICALEDESSEHSPIEVDESRG
jgi:type I restriction-modification system DNA methylase subunit